MLRNSDAHHSDKDFSYLISPQQVVRSRRYSLVICSYDVLRNDCEFFAGLKWNYCVLDEGHVIKNTKTKVSQAIRGKGWWKGHIGSHVGIHKFKIVSQLTAVNSYNNYGFKIDFCLSLQGNWCKSVPELPGPWPITKISFNIWRCFRKKWDLPNFYYRTTRFTPNYRPHHPTSSFLWLRLNSVS